MNLSIITWVQLASMAVFLFASWFLVKIAKKYIERNAASEPKKRKKRRGPWAGIHWYALGFVTLLVLWAYFTYSFVGAGCSQSWAKVWATVLIALILAKPTAMFVAGCKTFEQTRVYWVLLGSKIHTIIYLNDDGHYNNPFFTDFNPDYLRWEFIPAEKDENMELYQAPEGLLPWLVWKYLKRRFIGLDGITVVDRKPITREVKVALDHIMANPEKEETRHKGYPERIELSLGSVAILPNTNIVLRKDNTDSAPRVARSTFFVTDCESKVKAKVHQVTKGADGKEQKELVVKDFGAKLAALVSPEFLIVNAELYRLRTGSSDLYFEIAPLIETAIKEFLSRVTYEQGVETSGLRVVESKDEEEDNTANKPVIETGEKILADVLEQLNANLKKIGIFCKSFLIPRVEPMPEFRGILTSAAKIQEAENRYAEELVNNQTQTLINNREIAKQTGISKANVAGSIELAEKISTINNADQLEVLKRSVTPNSIHTLVEGTDSGVNITPAAAA